MATINRLLTAEEYAQLPDNGAPTELVRGRIVEMNIPASRHGWLCIRIGKLGGLRITVRQIFHN